MVAPSAPRCTARPHTLINTWLPVSPSSGTQAGSDQDSDVQGWRPLFISSEPCGSTWWRPFTRMHGYPKGFIRKQTFAYLLTYGLSAGQWDTHNSDPPPCTLVVCQNQSGESSAHFPSRYRSAPSRPWSMSWSIPRTQSQCSRRRELSLVQSVLAPTLDRPRSHWACACRNIVRPSIQKGQVTDSAVVEHVLEAGHQVKLFKAAVINYHPHTQTCCLLESWHIQHHQVTRLDWLLLLPPIFVHFYCYGKFPIV